MGRPRFVRVWSSNTKATTPHWTLRVTRHLPTATPPPCLVLRMPRCLMDLHEPRVATLTPCAFLIGPCHADSGRTSIQSAGREPCTNAAKYTVRGAFRDRRGGPCAATAPQPQGGPEGLPGGASPPARIAAAGIPGCTDSHQPQVPYPPPPPKPRCSPVTRGASPVGIRKQGRTASR